MSSSTTHPTPTEPTGGRAVQKAEDWEVDFFIFYVLSFSIASQSKFSAPAGARCSSNNSLDFHYLDVTLINLLIILCVFYLYFSLYCFTFFYFFFFFTFSIILMCQQQAAPASAVTSAK